MTTELTKAAQQALAALRRAETTLRLYPAWIGLADECKRATEALTQRPAAQTERDILNDSAWIAGAKFGWNCGVEGTRDLLNQCIEQRIKDRVEARASLPAPQQATPTREAREAEQRERMQARLADRPASKATADFDLPAPNDAAQQATTERHLTVTTNQQGEAVMVSWQDDEHRILEVVWEREQATPEPLIVKGAMAGMVDAQVRDLWPTKGATPEPVWEPFGWLFQHEETGLVQVVDSQQIEWGFEANNPRWQKIRPVYTHSAPTQQAAGEPVAALVRARSLTTRAEIAADGKDHFSDWGPWEPQTLSYAKAVTSPDRNTHPELYEMAPLYTQPAPGVPEGWRVTAKEDGRIVVRSPVGDAWSWDDTQGDGTSHNFVFSFLSAMLAAAQAKGGV